MLIALEGIDQSGKKTQASLLAQRLRELGYEVEQISFPDYSTPIGREIRAFLEGRRPYRPEIRQLLYVANRWELRDRLEGWLREGKVVIADRYVPSGLAYGLANGLDLDWMVELEKGLPEPELVIILDISPTEASRRKVGQDVYERDYEFLQRVRSSYLQLAREFGWVVIDGSKPIDRVSESIWKTVKARIERTTKISSKPKNRAWSFQSSASSF